MTRKFLWAIPAALLLSATAARAEPAKLGVVIVVDQLSMAQLDKWEDVLPEGGIRRLLGGAVSRDARYQGGPTLTAHGHATLSTGAYAARHGIVGNDWWERGLGLQHAAQDTRHRLLTRPDDKVHEEPSSPAQLRAGALADALRWSRPGAKVVALSLKARGAVFLGGMKPTAAVWFDSSVDRWTTSTYFGTELPAWVPDGAVSGTLEQWTRLVDTRLCGLLPKAVRPADAAKCAEVLADRRAGPDDVAEERGEAGFGPTFPHVLPKPGEKGRGRFFLSTPYADEALGALALKAIDGEQLGADDVPDLLTVSFSAFDYVGHDFGPESHESFDHLLRVDAAIARLLSHLDAKVGRGAYVVGFAADHGVKPTPAKARANGLYAGTIDTKKMIADAEAALDAVLGPKDWLGPFVNTGFSYRDGALAGVDRPRADAIVMDVIQKTPGVAEAWQRSLFLSGLALRGNAAVFARSYFDGRSPDFVVHPQPLYITDDVAAHGTAYLADLRVPFAIYRGNRLPLRIEGTVDVASLTPTMALVLGSAPPFAAEAGILTNVVEHLK